MFEAKKILVVDDDVAIRRLARIVLTRCGFSVEEARNGFEAISAMNERRYDAILLDLMMPGCSGSEVIRFFQESGLTRPCFIIMSAASDRQIAVLDKTLVHSILRKPFDIDDLARVVSRCVGSQAQVLDLDSVKSLQQHPN